MPIIHNTDILVVLPDSCLFISLVLGLGKLHDTYINRLFVQSHRQSICLKNTLGEIGLSELYSVTLYHHASWHIILVFCSWKIVINVHIHISILASQGTPQALPFRAYGPSQLSRGGPFHRSFGQKGDGDSRNSCDKFVLIRWNCSGKFNLIYRKCSGI